MRLDGRANNELRKVKITRRYTENPAGSVLIEMGKTIVLCTVMAEDGVPTFLLNQNQGWLSAEYAMLPGSTPQRKVRDVRRGQVDGRSVEIQRLVGRALRAVTDLGAFPNQTVWLDCDVVQADGGTRTAAITGAFVALHDAFKELERRKLLKRWPLRANVAAASVGIVDGHERLDLCYLEDSNAEVDMNIVMTSTGQFVEVQGSAEKGTFDERALAALVQLGRQGVEQLIEMQRKALGLTA
ncbi:MAG: ribonuclease PH [Planctomycetota bacterium]